MIQDETIEQILFPKPRVVTEQEKQQAREVHGGFLYRRVLVLRVCRRVVAYHCGKQVRHEP